MNILSKPVSPGNWHPGRFGAKPIAVVIHISTNSALSAANWFNDPHSDVSAHYLVCKNGEVFQFVEEKDTAYHAGTVDRPTWKLYDGRTNPNKNTVGIEHEGAETDVWTDEMYDSSARLIAAIARRWGFPINTDHVVPHHAIRASKPCPGSMCDLSKLISLALGHSITLPDGPIAA